MVNSMSILEICDNGDVLSVLRIVNIVLTIIRIVVPITLMVSLMINYVGAVKNNDADALAKANKLAVVRTVAAVLVFLVATLVNIIFSVIISKDMDYKDCTTCLNKPFSSECKFDYSKI